MTRKTFENMEVVGVLRTAMSHVDNKLDGIKKRRGTKRDIWLSVKFCLKCG